MSGTTPQVGAAWRERISNAPRPWRAGDLYLGRGFSDAKSAALTAGANLLIVSAGLGLVSAESLSPSYDLTVAASAPDSVLRKTAGDARAWWREVESALEARPNLDGGLILAALSRPYLNMVADAWSAWPQERLRRLRLFSKEAPTGLSEALTLAWMPYDDRLDLFDDGVYAGTQGDFAQRALRHFVEKIGVEPESLDVHRAVVAKGLEGLQSRERPNRERLDDADITLLIRRDWSLVGGRSGAMLRHLRDSLGVACEQGRFKSLFHAVASDREGSLI